jgi:hypothetical protein
LAVHLVKLKKKHDGEVDNPMSSPSQALLPFPRWWRHLRPLVRIGVRVAVEMTLSQHCRKPCGRWLPRTT